MNRTPLYNEHLNLNGKIVEFAGWELPVLYRSIIEEHTACRTGAALFDVSHMGEITVKGKDASEYLRKLIPTSLDRLEPNRCMYSCLCNEQGGVVDDLFIYMIAPDNFFLVVNAATVEKDFRWLSSHRFGDVDIENISGTIAKIDIQGPISKQILSQVIPDKALQNLSRFNFFYTSFRNHPLLISCSGYTGETGYELYIHTAAAAALWKEILAQGKDFGLLPAGLGARDTLRLECCYSLYGHELSDNVTPVEAGIGWIINSKDDFIAKNILVRQKKSGAPRETIALELAEKGIPREHCIVRKNGADIGHTTSGGYSPTFKKGIALALVKSREVKTGDEIEVVIRDKTLKAVVVKRPFYRYMGTGK
ncbi:MAG: glycine cleavage system aminomethyltransferase GcvT [Spirochaetota bacterium]